MAGVGMGGSYGVLSVGRTRRGQGRAGQGIAGGEAGRLGWAVTQGVGVDVCMAR